MVERECTLDGEVSVETGYYISSLGSEIKQLGSAIRAHWGIENCLHQVLDIAFPEDESKICKDHAPENFAILRHMALNLLRKETSVKRIKRKRLRTMTTSSRYFMRNNTDVHEKLPRIRRHAGVADSYCLLDASWEGSYEARGITTLP
jgi:hypothetical protein